MHPAAPKRYAEERNFVKIIFYLNIQDMQSTSSIYHVCRRPAQTKQSTKIILIPVPFHKLIMLSSTGMKKKTYKTINKLKTGHFRLLCPIFLLL